MAHARSRMVWLKHLQQSQSKSNPPSVPMNITEPATHDRTIRVFISSTFRDLNFARDPEAMGSPLSFSVHGRRVDGTGGKNRTDGATAMLKSRLQMPPAFDQTDAWAQPGKCWSNRNVDSRQTSPCVHWQHVPRHARGAGPARERGLPRTAPQVRQTFCHLHQSGPAPGHGPNAE